MIERPPLAAFKLCGDGLWRPDAQSMEFTITRKRWSTGREKSSSEKRLGRLQLRIDWVDCFIQRSDAHALTPWLV